MTSSRTRSCSCPPGTFASTTSVQGKASKYSDVVKANLPQVPVSQKVETNPKPEQALAAKGNFQEVWKRVDVAIAEIDLRMENNQKAFKAMTLRHKKEDITRAEKHIKQKIKAAQFEAKKAASADNTNLEDDESSESVVHANEDLKVDNQKCQKRRGCKLNENKTVKPEPISDPEYLDSFESERSAEVT